MCLFFFSLLCASEYVEVTVFNCLIRDKKVYRSCQEHVIMS